MIAIKIGTTSWRATETLAVDEVEFTGQFLYEADGLTPAMVWDATINHVRALNAAETLAAAKSKRIEAVKTERDRRKFEGVFVGANRFHSDADSRTQQIGLVLMGANLTAVQWKTMGGGFVTMTPTLAGQIFGATAQRDITVFAVAEAHIAAINLLDDPDAVMAYDITTGWPA